MADETEMQPVADETESEMQPVGYKASAAAGLSRNKIIAISVIIVGGLAIGIGVGLGFGLNKVETVDGLNKVETVDGLNDVETVDGLNKVEPVNVTVECEDGFVYGEKCYFAIIYPTERIQFQHKESNCSAKGGKIGSILNLEHQILAENYVRPKIPSSSTHTWMWLGSIYSNSTETFITPEGHSFPSTSIRWNVDDPKPDSTKTTMLLDVWKDKTNENNGVYNIHALPKTHCPAVFCEM